jgi:NADH-quinone oxidoreductase subunit E
MPKRQRPWQTDPGHIHDVPEPPPMPDEQGELLEDVSLASELAVEEAREPEGDAAPVPDPSEIEVPSALAQQIRRAMERYPEPRSASIPALWAVQRHYGWCSPEGIAQAASVMGVTPAYLEAVASFYDLFHLEPRGEHQVLVCTNISCWLSGADHLLDSFSEAAGDPAVFVRGSECLGACDIAPMASIDERYYGPLTGADAVTAIEQLRSGNEVLAEKRLEDRPAAGGDG